MAITLKYFLIGDSGGFDEKTGKIKLEGINDVVASPIFPTGIPKLVALLGFSGLEKNTLFEMRVNGPENELIGKVEFGVPVHFARLTARQIIPLQQLPVMVRGKYTVDILEKTESGFKFLTTQDLFTAMYPPKRRFAEGEITEILAKGDEVIKEIMIKFGVPNTEKIFNLQLNLDETAPILEGFEPFPANNKLIFDGKEYDLEGIRRENEWKFGREKPKKDDSEEKQKK